MRRAIRILIVGLFALAVVVPATPVASASAVHSGSFVAAAGQPPTATPTGTAPAGPTLNPEQQQSKSKQKLIIGFFAAVLLVIVFFGRRSHNKHLKKLKGATGG